MGMRSKFKKFIAILGNPTYRQALLKYRVAAAVEHDNLLRQIGAALRTVVDIGANRGQFTLVARQYAQGAYIFAFEPLTEPAEVFRKVFQDDANTELHHCAIGAREGEALMHVSRADDSSSLLPITAMQTSTFPGTEERGTRRVTITPLDAALYPEQIQAPALLKIDVQGYELEVLKGCVELLGSFDYLLVECSYVELYTGQALAGEVIAHLTAAGFEMVERYKVVHDARGDAVQADFFFRRK